MSVWSLSDTYQFLLATNGGCSRYPAEQIDQMRNNRAFTEYLLSVTMTKLDGMLNAPSYQQIKYSKSSYTSLCQTTQIVYRIYMQQLFELLDGDKLTLACLSIECFRKCLITADHLYKRKFAEFQKMIGELKAEHINDR